MQQTFGFFARFAKESILETFHCDIRAIWANMTQTAKVIYPAFY